MHSNNSKTVLVTGASRGIGLLTVKALAVRGHTVFASMRDLDKRNRDNAQALLSWASANDLDVRPLELDVTCEQSVNHAIASVEEQLPLDVIVNNAGSMPVGLGEGFTLAQMQACFEVNTFGIARVHRAALPYFRKRQQGLFINISSSAGRLAIPYFSVYCASKWAMEAYCESLHYELAPLGIESILVEPSGHATDLVTSAPAPADHAVEQRYGALAEGREKLLGMFKTLFEQEGHDTDAANVAETIATLVNSHSPHPIRTQVGQDMGVEAINKATEPLQRQLVEMLKPVYAG